MKQVDLFTVAPELILEFNEVEILFKEVESGIIETFETISPCDLKYYDVCKMGNSIASVHPKGHRFNSIKLHPEKTSNTIAAGSDIFHYEQKRKLDKEELCKIGSYPNDYDFVKNKPIYLIGMSVPPVMTARIADEIFEQWLKFFNEFEKTKADEANFLKSFETLKK
jgi:DNA (cytosine-5)-methyltransferase 1